jgi:hypothetical protein
MKLGRMSSQLEPLHIPVEHAELFLECFPLASLNVNSQIGNCTDRLYNVRKCDRGHLTGPVACMRARTNFVAIGPMPYRNSVTQWRY